MQRNRVTTQSKKDIHLKQMKSTTKKIFQTPFIDFVVVLNLIEGDKGDGQIQEKDVHQANQAVGPSPEDPLSLKMF